MTAKLQGLKIPGLSERKPSFLVVGLWWATWLIAGSLACIPLMAFGSRGPLPDDLAEVNNIRATAEALTVVAAICAIRIVRTINRNQIEFRRCQRRLRAHTR